jgi:hypothetical protein
MYELGTEEHPVWDSARLGPGGCPPPPVSRTVFGRLDSARTLLGDSLAPGPYRFTALLHTLGGSVEVDAGRVFVTADPRPVVRAPRGLTYRSRSAVGGKDRASVQVAVQIINRTDRRVALEYGACPLQLLVHENADRAGPAVWNSAKQLDETGQLPVCPLYLKFSELGPGETRKPDFRATFPVADILGDSLPDGKYHFTAQLVLGGDTVPLPAGSGTLRQRRM